MTQTALADLLAIDLSELDRSGCASAAWTSPSRSSRSSTASKPQGSRGAAYHTDSAVEAEALLEALARELDETRPAPPAAAARACTRR